jgi:mono/diheme cytochrome c family protein
LSLFVLALLTLAASACSISLAEDVTPPPGYQPPAPAPLPTPAPVQVSLPDRTPDLARGAAIYAESCQPCHGSAGLGDGPQAAQLPNPATALGDPEIARQAEPEAWYRVVTQGRLDRFMPPFTSLSDAERWDVVFYALTLSGDSQGQGAASAAYQEQCAACHGEDGAGDGPEAASLSVAPTSFLDPAFLAVRSGAQLYGAITSGIPPAMPGFEAALSDEARWALVEHLRSLALTADPVQAASAGEEVPQADLESTPEEIAAPEAAAVSSGTVTGVVVNGSGAQVPGGLEVVLHGFDHIEEVYTATTTIEADGSYSFGDVEMPEARIFMVSVDYSDTTYTSDLAIAEADSQALNLPVTVYETTSETAALVIDRLHIFIENIGPDLLQVTELYLVSNAGDRVVVPEDQGQPVVRYTLPAEAQNLRFQPGTQTTRFVELPDGFGDTMGIPPGTGQYQVMYAYDLTYDRGLDYVKNHDMPVNSVIVLLPDMGLRVRSDQLQDAGPREIQGEQFLVYTSQRLDTAAPLELSLTGRLRSPGVSAIDATPGSALMIGMGVFGLSLVVTGAWVYRRAAGRRKKPPAEEEMAPADPGALMDSIIALDDLYRSGELPEEAYRQRRSELKDRLRDAL